MPAEQTPPSETPESPAAPPARRFEDFTLAEALGQLFRAPRLTLAALNAVTHPRARRGHLNLRPEIARAALTLESSAAPDSRDQAGFNVDALVRLLFWAFGLAMLWLANQLYVTRSFDSAIALRAIAFEDNLLFFGGGLLFIALAELYISRARAKFLRDTPDALEITTPPDASRAASSGLNMGAFVLAVIAGAGAYALNGSNQFTLFGVMLWISSIGLALYAFAPRDARVTRWIASTWGGLRAYVMQNRAAMLALALIVLVGTVARFQSLALVPPEMTSDHMEKLIDAQRVQDGSFDVFFQGNGGREPIQMYLLALYSSITGTTLNFDSLKVIAALEGVLTLPAMYALGVTLMGDRNRKLGIWLGLAAALFMAVGYWHLAIGRVSLRIILTPLVTALLLTFLIRGMRTQSRTDWLLAGVTLGVGLYTYQAVRMLPVVVIVGAGLAFVSYARTGAQRRALIFNFIALIFVSFAIFVPMFRFSVEYPDDFWRRSSGRLFGDDLIVETLEDGTMLERTPTLQERVDAFGRNVPLLGENIRNVLLMFNYRGDVIYLHNAAGFPAFTPLMGALFAAGVIAWIARLIRKRDAAEALVLLTLLIMLLPSALSIANPGENPSHTRTSGAMPSAYLLAAFGFIGLMIAARRLILSRWQIPVTAAALIAFGAIFYSTDTSVIVNEYRQNYIATWKPLSDGGRLLRGFAESDGAYGNAFMLAYPHWWDYRIVASEAGIAPMRWTNGDIELQMLPQKMAEAVGRDENDIGYLHPDRDLLIMYADEHEEASAQLKEWFPDGRESRLPTYRDDVFVRVYRVPALGVEALGRWLIEYGGIR